MDFKKKAEGIWSSDDGLFGAVLHHYPGMDKKENRYYFYAILKDDVDDDDDDPTWQDEIYADTLKKAILQAEKMYRGFLDKYLKAAQTAKKKIKKA